MSLSRLETLNATVSAKRDEIGNLIKSKPNKDFTSEEVTKLASLNDELAKLAPELEQLQKADRVIKETEAYLNGQSSIGEGLPGAGGSKGGDGKPIGLKLGNGEVINLRDEKGNLLSDSAIKDQIEAIAKKTAFPEDGGEGGGFVTRKAAAMLADAFIKSPAFMEYSKSARKSPETELEFKTLLDTTGFPVASTRSDRIVPYPLRRLVVSDLFPSGNITQPRFLYMEETTATNNAAPVAEGGTKPESAIAFTERSADVRKIATVLPVTDELFEDAPAMRAYVQMRLTMFLQLAEENQILNGSGVAPAILGLLNNPGIQTQAKATDTIVDALYKAITKVEVNAMLPTSGIVLHPNDWMRVRLSKDANGQYLFGSPMAADIDRIFGYPVVRTQALTEGTGLVGAFDLAAMILRRTGIAFAVSTEHSDFFIKNQLMLRVEERLAFPVFRPSGFCTATGLNA